MNKLRIIPLGGVMGIGKNLWCYEYNDDIIIVDCGYIFPTNDMPGVDYLIPDMSYLAENRDRIRGVFLTHGHEDHIGAVPYLLKLMSVPIYGTALTLGFVSNKLDEHNLLNTAELYEVSAGDILEVGGFEIEFFQVAHSIPDTCALVIRCDLGTLVHASDFKFDKNAVNGFTIDFDRLKEISRENVLAFMCDTTNIEKPGNTKSEKIVGENLDKIIREAPGRVIFATFSSNLNRIQQVIDICQRYNRKICFFGRSLVSNCRIAEVLGYLKFPFNIRIDESEIDNYPEKELVIITTGCQGEERSVLTQIANEEHKSVDIVSGDTVIISSTPIPGNEVPIINNINNLFEQGANVIYSAIEEVHVSGHANRDDIKTVIDILKPKKYFSVHGEWRHYNTFRNFLLDEGVREEDIVGLQIGDVYEFNDMTDPGICDRVKAGYLFVDGSGIGDIDRHVLEERIHLRDDGVIAVSMAVDFVSKEIVRPIEFIDRGVIKDELKDRLFAPLSEKIGNAVSDFFSGPDSENCDALRSAVKKITAKYIYEKTRRRPMILPVVLEV